MTTITAELRTKIERRAKRAWKRRREGSKDPITRVSDVTEMSLKYRLPYSPDYYGAEKVVVILKADGTLEVDPKTTGLIDILLKDDIKLLKKHGGEVRAYMLVKSGTTWGVGSTYQYKSDPLKSMEQCLDQVVGGDHVYAVEAEADDLTLGFYDTDDFTAREFEVKSELDPAKHLGFTTGLLDCLTKADVERLRKKKHTGRVRAYKYTTKDAESPVRTGASEKIKYEVGKYYEIKDADTDEGSNCHKGINVANVAWCRPNNGNGQRMFAFEFDMKDVAAIPSNTDGKFRVHRCLCVEELDPTTFKALPPAPAPAPAAPMLPAVIAPVVAAPDSQIVSPTKPDAPVEPQVDAAIAPATDKPKKGFFGRLFGD
jgi:hypothetical protein